MDTFTEIENVEKLGIVNVTVENRGKSLKWTSSKFYEI